MRLIYCIVLVSCLVLGATCKKPQPEQPPDTGTDGEVVYFALDAVTANQLEVEKTGDHQFKITTTGSDPYIQMQALKQPRKVGEVVLTFEYRSSANLSHLQVFFGAPVTEERSVKTEQVASASSWRVFSLDIGDEIDMLDWGGRGDFLRLDVGDEAGIIFDIRNVRLRERNEREQQEASDRVAFRLADQELDQHIRDYLGQSFPAAISQVSVASESITIRGTYPSGEAVELAEITPYQQIVPTPGVAARFPVDQPSFGLTVERFVERDGFRYDRALSQWAVIRQSGDQDELYSHARYADVIQPKWSMVQQKPRHRKGLGGYAFNRGFVEDLDDLDIASATVNIPITSFIYLNERADSYIHHYGGNVYYFDRQRIHELDETLQATSARNITVAAIILVQKSTESADPLVGNLLQDENYTSDAFFTMPRMDNAESLHCYAAALDFLADRYSRPGSPNGRIHHWIMHNEVDAGSIWTNMGKNRLLHVYLDRYYKSLRMCYTIVREYDEHAEVLASFTHSWAQIAPGGDYAVRDMLEGLLSYSRVEGDFRWGLAYHPYPEDLNEPKTWNDGKATFSMESPLVTFKNLEVLDRWIKIPDHQYNNMQKRTLWLSENGTNSRSYSEEHLHEQAAGFAYAWKKMSALDGIDAMQWHNWIDNRHEFGLHIGLRKFPDDETDPGGKKPVWYAYQAAGTADEDAVFEPYKSIIGIRDWSEIMRNIN